MRSTQSLTGSIRVYAIDKKTAAVVGTGVPPGPLLTKINDTNFKVPLALLEQCHLPEHAEIMHTDVLKQLLVQVDETAEEVDVKFHTWLKCYQVECTKKLLSSHKKTFLLLDAGLGKTAIVAHALQAAPRPALIIVPKDKQLDWQRELMMWSNIDSYRTKNKEDHGMADVVITSYDCAHLLAKPFMTIVADEAHLLRNHDTRRYGTIAPLFQSCSHRWLLTATPMLNTLDELWATMSLLAPVGPYNAFAERYQSAVWVQMKGRRVMKLGVPKFRNECKLLLETMSIRITRDQVLAELPPKKRVLVEFEPPGEFKEEMAKKQTELKLMQAVDNVPRIQMLVAELVRMSCDAVFDQMVEYCREIARAGHTFLIFAYNIEVLENMQRELAEFSSVVIKGEDTIKEKDKKVAMLRRGDVRVGLLSISCCNAGINLTPVATSVFLQRLWTASAHEQAESRTHRIGATKECTHIYLSCKHSYDENQMRKIDKKSQLCDFVVGGVERFGVWQ